MSKKLIEQTKRPEEIKLTDVQFAFVRGVTTIQQQAAYNYEVIKTNYLHEIAQAHGYTDEDSIQMAVDLDGDEHTLRIIPFTETEE